MDSNHLTPASRSRAAFTLVEMLVVIGIILLLMGLAMPMVNRAYKSAVRTRMAADIQAIVTGLDAYKADHGDYPRNMPAGDKVQGAELLCWALIAPGRATLASQDGAPDGQDGPGFKVRVTGGQTYGPYLNVNQFKVGYDAQVTGAKYPQILDRYKHAILYFPANSTGDAKTAFVTDWTTGKPNRPVFNHNDNSLLPLDSMQTVLGDKNLNGKLDPGETAAFSGPYILWSAGVNETFGHTLDQRSPATSTGKPNASVVIDDVMNFAP